MRRFLQPLRAAGVESRPDAVTRTRRDAMPALLRRYRTRVLAPAVARISSRGRSSVSAWLTRSNGQVRSSTHRPDPADGLPRRQGTCISPPTNDAARHDDRDLEHDHYATAFHDYRSASMAISASIGWSSSSTEQPYPYPVWPFRTTGWCTTKVPPALANDAARRARRAIGSSTIRKGVLLAQAVRWRSSEKSAAELDLDYAGLDFSSLTGGRPSDAELFEANATMPGASRTDDGVFAYKNRAVRGDRRSVRGRCYRAAART